LIGDKPAEEGILETVTYPVYIGSNSNVKIKEKHILLIPEKTNWVAKKIHGCISKDPNKCTAWYIVIESEAVYETIIIAKQPKKVPDEDIIWETFDIPYSTAGQVSGITEWREVLCSNQVTSMVIESIQHALIEHGYSFIDVNNQFDLSSKNALVDYQKKNGLPINVLDFETLKSLNIAF